MTLLKKLTGEEASKEVDALFQSAPMQAYHRAIPNYRALTLVRLDPDLPEDFARGVTGSLHSTRIFRIAQRIKSKAAGYPRFTDAIARSLRTGVPTQALMDKADRLGRTLTALNAELDAGMRVSNDTRDFQFIDGWTAWQLHKRKQPDGTFKFEVEVCDPLTCAFTEMSGGTYRPKRFARKLRMTVERVKAAYGKYGELKVKNGVPDWTPISVARPEEDGPATAATGNGQQDDNKPDAELLVKIYDDGCHIYHVVCDSNGKSPQRVWCQRNTTHKPGEAPEYFAAAVVVPGNTVAYGGDGEKMLPVLWGIENIVNNLNLVNDIRMTTAMRHRPGTQIVIADKTPEEIERLKELQAIRPAAATDGTDVLVYAAGDKVQPWEVVSNDDLDKIIAQQTDELNAAEAELLVQTDPEVVAQASATAFHLSTGAVETQQTNWLQNGDFAWAHVGQMICNDAQNNDDEYSYVAPSELLRSDSKSVEKGAMLKLSPADLDFDYDVSVATRQETEDQKNKRFLNEVFKYDKGFTTFLNVIKADTVDPMARISELDIEDGWKLVQTAILAHMPGLMQQRIRDGAGVLVPFSPADFVPPEVGATAPAAGPTQTFAPAPPPGPEGVQPGAMVA